MLADFDAHIADKNYPWSIREILPKVLVAGENAGYLTAEGAKLSTQQEHSKLVLLCAHQKVMLVLVW